MKNQYKLLVLSIMSIALMLFSASAHGVVAQGNPGEGGSNNFEVTTGNVTIKVVGGGNVPMYTLTDVNSNDSYRVQFKQVFEFYDDNSDGAYNEGDSRVAGPPYALASLSWEFSEVVNDSDGTHFNISSSDGLFTFANHIGDNANSLKFDVIISEAFEFNVGDSMLALAFSLTSNGEVAEDAEQEGDRVEFGGAFFEIVDTAEADNSTLDVGLSSNANSSDSIAYISYPQFDGEMVHDPEIGVDDTAADGTADDEASEETESGLNSWLVMSVALLVPVVTYKLNKREN